MNSTQHLKFLPILAVLITHAGCGHVVGPDSPSDEIVRAIFNDHRDSLVVLADMIANEPNVSYVHSEGWTSSNENGDLSDERLAQYLELMNEVGAVCVREQYGDVEITLFAEGNVAESFSLGLMRAEEVPASELADTTYDTVNDNTSRYAHIEGDWYVYRVHD